MIRRLQHHRRRRGLTLIELLVVMMILVILAGSISLYVVNKADQARVARAKSDISTIESALEQYAIIMGDFPTTEQGLQALIAAPSGVEQTKWQQGGPFIRKRNFNDPWQNEYLYRQPGTNGADYDVFSLGADGREGGEGTDADISSADLADNGT